MPYRATSRAESFYDRLTAETGTTRINVARWLDKVADELDARFGPHPTVGLSRTQVIAHELVDKSDEPNKEGLKKALDEAIARGFNGG
jgi:hypothetical protein